MVSVCFDFQATGRSASEGRNELSICKIKLDSDLRRRIENTAQIPLEWQKCSDNLTPHSIKGKDSWQRVMKPINKIDTTVRCKYRDASFYPLKRIAERVVHMLQCRT